MDRDEKLLRYLELVSQRVIHHGDTLWEEEKHYSWWIYPILAGLVYVILSVNTCPELKLGIVVAGGILGFIISVAAIKVIRRESRYFWETILMRRNLVRALKLDEEKLVSKEPVLSEQEWESMSQKQLTERATPSLGHIFKSFFCSDTGIRAVFQVTFLVTAAAFIGLIVWQVVSYLCCS